jgi:uncharacterized protein YndB with AHSA1/START domain
MIELEFYIPLSTDHAWDRLVQTPHIRKWWSNDVTLDTSEGMRFSQTWVDKDNRRHFASGPVTSVEPGHRLQFDYRRDDWPRATRIEFMLSPEKPGSRLYIQHSGWDALPDEKARVKEVDAYARIWKALMENFVKYCAA